MKEFYTGYYIFCFSHYVLINGSVDNSFVLPKLFDPAVRTLRSFNMSIIHEHDT